MTTNSEFTNSTKSENEKLFDNYTIEPVDLLGGESPKIEFLVPGAIPRSNIILLSGESGSGKSWVAYDLLKAVCSGGPWLGRTIQASQNRAILFNWDNPTDTLSIRMRKLDYPWHMELRMHTGGKHKAYRGLPPMLRLMDHHQQITGIIQHWQPALIVVDSLRQAHHLDENSSKDMAALMSIFKQWTDINSASVVLVHHTAKGEVEGGWKASARGSGEIIASAGVVIEARVARDGGENTLTWTKHQAWDVGSVNECTFEVKDVPVNEEEEDEWFCGRTECRATSPLPGEPEYNNRCRLMEKLSSSPQPLTYQEVKKLVGIADAPLRLAIQTELREKTIRHCRFGAESKRGYTLRSRPDHGVS